MAHRPAGGYADDRVPAERQNEYFLEKDGISREVIQADICRYLGNDALVKPGNHQGRPGYFIRAYRNLTSEMIADLKADSARWEADVARRAEKGYPRAHYNSSSIHETRQQATYPPATQAYDPYSNQPSNAYPSQQNPTGYAPQYGNQQGGYPTDQTGYGNTMNPYAQQGQSPPPVTTSEMQSSYTHAPGNAYAYADPRASAPRYAGQPYENDQDYSGMVTTSMSYPATSAPVPMDPRYAQEPVYQDPRNRTSGTLPPGNPHRRPR